MGLSFLTFLAFLSLSSLVTISVGQDYGGLLNDYFYGGGEGLGLGGNGLGGLGGHMPEMLGENPRSPSDLLNRIKKERSGEKNLKKMKVGSKTFKLFDKKNRNFSNSKAFCKDREGEMGQGQNVEEMQNLQALITRSNTQSPYIWIGTDMKEWKKHAVKINDGFQPDFGPQATLVGGGKKQMCPAFSLSTRSLVPLECHKELPFICQFPEGKGKKIKKPKDEMRRKRSLLEKKSKDFSKKEVVVEAEIEKSMVELEEIENTVMNLKENNSEIINEIGTEGSSSVGPGEESSTVNLKSIDDDEMSTTSILDDDWWKIQGINSEETSESQVLNDSLTTTETETATVEGEINRLLF